MPELPEVETLCRQLRLRTVGDKILAARVFDDKINDFKEIRQRPVTAIRRRGKTILLDLDRGRSLAIHLRMTGRLLWHNSRAKLPHSRWRLRFATGNIDLIDPRRFATVKIEETVCCQDTLDLFSNFDMSAFLAKQAPRKVCVKILLMDPQAVAGIGNIYASEILHRAGISPLRLSSTLGKKEWKNIFRFARLILKKAIEKRGTSISDWRDLDGLPGENQHELRVYGKEGQNCPNCGLFIQKIKQGGRSTYFCAGCQGISRGRC